MITSFLWVAAAVVIALFLWNLKKGREEEAAAPAKSAADAWIAAVARAAIAKKTALPASALEKAFAGEPDPETVSAVEAAVRDVRVRVEKLAREELEVRATIAFEDGTHEEHAKKFSSGDVSEAMRGELAKTGAAFAFATWDLPWRS